MGRNNAFNLYFHDLERTSLLTADGVGQVAEVVIEKVERLRQTLARYEHKQGLHYKPSGVQSSVPSDDKTEKTSRDELLKIAKQYLAQEAAALRACKQELVESFPDASQRETLMEKIKDSQVFQREIQKRIDNIEEQHNRIVNGNLRLVVLEAKKFSGNGIPLLDLIQEGNIGLIKAARKFDFTRKRKFSTFASVLIRRSILKAIPRHKQGLTVHESSYSAYINLIRTEHYLLGKLGRPATIDEKAAFLEVDPVQAREILTVGKALYSLDGPRPFDNNEHGTLYDLIRDPNAVMPQEAAEEAELRTLPDKLLRTSFLTPRQTEVVRKYHGIGGQEPLNFPAMARHFGNSKQANQQAYKRALRKLKDTDSTVKEKLEQYFLEVA